MSCTKLALGLVLAVGTMLAADPAIGTWKLNLEKSKFSPGQALQSAVVVYEEAGSAVKRSGESVNADGSKMAFTYTAELDGKDYPLTGHPMADTISLKRIDERNGEGTLKKAGKPVIHVKRSISADGKTMTLTIKGTDMQGQKMSSVHVYDRQ